MTGSANADFGLGTNGVPTALSILVLLNCFSFGSRNTVLTE